MKIYKTVAMLAVIALLLARSRTNSLTGPNRGLVVERDHPFSIFSSIKNEGVNEDGPFAVVLVENRASTTIYDVLINHEDSAGYAKNYLLPGDSFEVELQVGEIVHFDLDGESVGYLKVVEGHYVPEEESFPVDRANTSD